VSIVILQQAQLELLAAISYYEAERAGLGQRFKDEVDRSLLWIAAHPDLHRARSGGYRRMNLRVFPYYIPYIIRGETVWILAVAHGSRRPEYWIGRKSTS
jgi:plasmid stabilization system protein ParE